MAEPITSKVESFLKNNETICFTKLITGPKEPDYFDSKEGCLGALILKESLLTEAYSLLKSLLGQLDLTDHLLRKDTEDMQEQIQKTIFLHRQEQAQMKVIEKVTQNILAEHYEKESTIDRQLIESNEQLEKVIALNEEKQRECEALRNALSELNDSFEQRITFCNRVTSQLQELHNDYSKLQEFNEIKLQQITSLTNYNEKLSNQIKDYEHQLAVLQIDNRELAEEVMRLRGDLEHIHGKMNMYEVMIGKTQTPDHSEGDKENIHTLNVPKEHTSAGGCYSPRNISNVDLKYLKVDPDSISYRKQHLNQLHLMKSGLNDTSGKGTINIEDKLIQYLTPMHRTDITDFEQCKIQTDFQPSKQQISSPPPDPYNCFFMLTVQCAKLNHPYFELAAEVDLNDLWETFLREMIPMNKWAKIIEQELQTRLYPMLKSKKNSVLTVRQNK